MGDRHGSLAPSNGLWIPSPGTAATGHYTGGQFTVGRPFHAWTDDRLGWAPLLFLGGAGVALAVVTFVQRRRMV
jgi:hypothetical protein